MYKGINLAHTFPNNIDARHAYANTVYALFQVLGAILIPLMGGDVFSGICRVLARGAPFFHPPGRALDAVRPG